MSLGIGWAIGLLVALAGLSVARGYLVRKQTGRSLPYVLTVLAGVVAVLLVTLLVGLLVVH